MAIEYMQYIIKNKEKTNEEILRDERKFMKNFFVIKNYFSKFGESFTYYFFLDLKIKIDNMLYYTILKLNPKISISSEEIINEIIDYNFIKIDLDLKDLYKNYISQKMIIILGNLSFNWYKCPKGHLYCVENNNEKTNNELKCPLCLDNGINCSNNKKIEIKGEVSSFIDKQIEGNPLLNQDLKALQKMKKIIVQNINNAIDPEIELIIFDGWGQIDN